MSNWQDINTAPKDGTNIMVWGPGFAWPEVVRYELFDEKDTEEAGQPGYWRYSEDVLCDACVIEIGLYTHWMPVPALPTHPQTTR